VSSLDIKVGPAYTGRTDWRDADSVEYIKFVLPFSRGESE